MKSFRSRLLGGAATILLSAFAAPAFSADVAAEVDTAVDMAASEEDIIVLGTGQTRQVQEIGAADIALATPGVSPLKAIDKLPGVNFQSADPFGSYEWSSRISIRGFAQTQLGFTLDGIPLGDMSYGNHNGLHISRAIISENVGRVQVSQGAGALSTASSSNLGGTIEFFSRGPKDAFGLEINGTYGSEDTKRGYIRLDSGELLTGGPLATISYAWQDADKWKGYGTQRQHQVNARIEQPAGDGKFFAFLNYSNRDEQDYQDLSAEMIDRLGYDWDNNTNDWAQAVQIAQVYNNQNAKKAGVALPYPGAGLTFPTPIATVDDTYFDASGLRDDWLAGLGLESQLSSALSVKLTGYYHGNKGRGLWYTPYVGTPGGAPISVRTTEYDIERYGILGSAAYEIGANRLEIGAWYEDNDFNQARRFYGLADAPQASRDALDFPKDPFFTQWEFDFNTETFQYYVQDTLDIGDLVTINAGWKGLRVENVATPVVTGGLASGTTVARDWFLPQAGVLFRVTPEAEIFAGYSENLRAFESSATGGPFATTQAGFDALDLKPETSTTYELGVRTKSGPFQGSIAGYYVEFKDRIVAFANGSSIAGNPAILSNVGDVKTWGIEAAGTFRITPEISLFASYAHNESEYQDDVVNVLGAVVVATEGKTVVNSPKDLARGEIVFDNQTFFARASASYTGERFYSFENDVSVPDFVIVDASIGYRFATGKLKGFTIQGNATNLLDKKYVSTIGTGAFGARGDNQILLAGAPQQFFVTIKTEF